MVETAPDGTVTALGHGYLFGLETLGAALDDKRHAAAFLKRAIAAGFDCREVYENILTVLASDESKFVTGQILAIDGGSVYH